MKNKVTYSQPSMEIEYFYEDVVLASATSTTRDAGGSDGDTDLF